MEKHVMIRWAGWLAIGTAAIAAAILAGPLHDNPNITTSEPAGASQEATSKPWPMNERGQTYGVQIDYQEPDLVSVATTDNRSGYAYRQDLRDPTPSSPEEALRWQAAQGGRPRYIPVYESDGMTEIGVFRIGGGAPAR